MAVTDYLRYLKSSVFPTQSPIPSGTTSSDVSTVYPQSTGGYTSSTGESLYVTPSGAPVASAQTPTYNAPSFPGGSSGGGIPLGALMEPTPEQPDVYNNPYQQEVDQAISSLRELESRYQGELPSTLANIQSGAESAAQGIEAERATRIGEYEQQQGYATEAGRQEEARQRRMVSELSQGIQSRFGGTSGIGAFASELMGRQGMENIASIRNEVMNTIGKISTAKSAIDDKAMSLRANIFAQAEQLKDQARRQLNDYILDIRSRTGQLQASKGEAAMQALNQYRDTIQQISARNAQLMQDIVLAASQAKVQLTGYQNMAKDIYQAQLGGYSNFNMGSLQIQPQAPAAPVTGIYNQALTQNPATPVEEDDPWKQLISGGAS